MKKEWTARTGKIEKLLIFYGGLSGAVLLYIMLTGTHKRTDMSQWDSSDTLFLLAFTSFIWIPVLFVTMKKILSAKIATKVQLDPDNKILKVEFSKNELREVHFDNLAYAVSANYDNHVGLTIYSIFLGTRNQVIKKKVTELIGLRTTFSWKKYQVLEIADELKALNIQELTADNNELPLWERIISN